jgi:peptidoglycan glycosyltransferase
VNTQIRRLGLALLVCFTALFAQLNYIQVFRAEPLNENPGNTRKVVESFSRPRGTIETAEGVILARSVPSDDQFRFQREFPEADLFGHVTGHFNFNFGSTGLEASYDDDLAGKTPEIDLATVSDLFVDREQVGNLAITIRKDVQEAARVALGDRAGSVVAVDPKTGAILAFWSAPSYDPNALSAHGDSAADARAMLEASPAKPLLPKMYRETFFPGSTFKVVTASAGVQTGRVRPDQPVYPVLPAFDIDFTADDLDNFGGDACGGSLFDVLKVSCNSSFAAMGSETIGPADMVAGAERFGFNDRPPIDLPAPAASRFPTEFPDNEGNGPLARASIGQGDVSSTPLQMALVAAAVANQGTIMAPHLMDRITDDQGEVVKTYEPRRWTDAMSPETAAVIRQGMIGVVDDGTATRLAIPGIEVGGKTGTAQLGTDPPRSHAWIIGFAGPPGDAKVAVAVIVEGQPGASEQTGGKVAAPIAKAVMEKVLQTQAGG